MYRQGDVLFIKVNKKLEKSLVREPETSGRKVVEYGEVTGHAHAFYTPDTVDIVRENDKRFLDVKKASELRHEEHATITFEPGVYEIKRQREYDPIANRVVAD